MNQVSASTRQLMKRGLSALAKQKGQEALGLFQEVLAINPQHAEALYHIGYLLHGSGLNQEASHYYQRAMAADPTYIKSYLMLCKIFVAQNDGANAVALAQHATQVMPNEPQAYSLLASVLLHFNQAHAVPAYLEQILPLFPDEVELHQFYCLALKSNYRLEEADAVYNRLVKNYRVPASFRILYETYLPRIYRSNIEIDSVRAQFATSIARFIAEKPRIDIGMLTNHPLFALAYHNRDNKDLLQRYTQMLREVAPVLNYKRPDCVPRSIHDLSPIRIGFVSRYMHNHPVGNCYRNVMLYLASQPEFSVVFFNLADVMDEKIQHIIHAGIVIESLPHNCAVAQTMVANHQLDILLYTDIGMDATTHYMAMARLAPYQACFQGHPETTGIDTIDYVISSRLYEPPHADKNYGEQLLCNEGIDTMFARPVPPDRWLTREELGLPRDKKLYTCPMAIQKFHPDFDEVLSGLLEKDPEAVLVLFNDFQQETASQFRSQRFLSQCDPSRVIFLPWLQLEALFSVMKVSDGVLDTIYFGGGTTAQYAFGLGIPIVTMPGDYARGRVVYAYYSAMGIQDAPVAATREEYITLAIKLAHDKEYAAGLEMQILAGNHRLFESDPYGPRVAKLMKDIVSQNLEGYRR